MAFRKVYDKSYNVYQEGIRYIPVVRSLTDLYEHPNIQNFNKTIKSINEAKTKQKTSSSPPNPLTLLAQGFPTQEHIRLTENPKMTKITDYPHETEF